MDNEMQVEPMMSPSIKELAKALCEVQKTKLFALTDKENPFFSSKYADLSSVWMALREPLTNNGLSVIQTNEPAEGGVIIVTMLLHTSGEWVRGRLFMRSEKLTPQAYGSAITYGRRYALAAIVGISPEDDDANKAMQREEKRKLIAQKKQTTTKKTTQTTQTEGDEEIKSVDETCETIGKMKKLALLQVKQQDWINSDKSDYSDKDALRISKAFEARIALLSTSSSDKKVTSTQAQLIYAEGSRCGWNNDQIKARMKEKYGIDSASDLTTKQHTELMKYMPVHKPEPHIVDDLDDELDKKSPHTKDELIGMINKAAATSDFN